MQGIGLDANVVIPLCNQDDRRVLRSEEGAAYPIKMSPERNAGEGGKWKAVLERAN